LRRSPRGRTQQTLKGFALEISSAIRDDIEAEMENILAGKKTSKQAWKKAVRKGNAKLKEFAAMYK